MCETLSTPVEFTGLALLGLTLDHDTRHPATGTDWSLAAYANAFGCIQVDGTVTHHHEHWRLYATVSAAMTPRPGPRGADPGAWKTTVAAALWDFARTQLSGVVAALPTERPVALPHVMPRHDEQTNT